MLIFSFCFSIFNYLMNPAKQPEPGRRTRGVINQINEHLRKGGNYEPGKKK